MRRVPGEASKDSFDVTVISYVRVSVRGLKSHLQQRLAVRVSKTSEFPTRSR